jgi:outer membrane receptor protein involved in Fe transport
MVGDTWRLHTNLTYQYAVSVKDYGARNHEIFNVPSFVANVIGDVTPLPSIFEKLRLHASVRYNGSQLSPIDVTFADAQGNVQQRYSAPNHRVSGYVLANAGLHIEDVLLEGLSGDLNVYNVFGQRYEQGGSPPHPYPQPGRWVLFTLGYRFTPA